jgi:flagellar protein FlaG
MNIGTIGSTLPPLSPQAEAQQQEAPPPGFSKEALVTGGLKETATSVREARGNPRAVPVGSRENAEAPENDRTQATGQPEPQNAPLTLAEQAEEEKKEQENAQGALRDSVEELKEFVKPFNTSLDFSIDEDTGRTVVKVVDKDSGDTIRQIPSEEMLAISKAIDQLKGLLIKQTA